MDIFYLPFRKLYLWLSGLLRKSPPPFKPNVYFEGYIQYPGNSEWAKDIFMETLHDAIDALCKGNQAENSIAVMPYSESEARHDA